MEKPKDTSKQEKKKMAISIGGGSGGNAGGVIVWVGVAAIATLVSVVSAIKSRDKRLPNKTNHQPPPVPSTTGACNQLEVNNFSANDDQGNGLLVLLHDNSSSPPDNHQSGDGIKDTSPNQIDSTPTDSSKSLILNIDTVLDITRPKEKPSHLDILLGDNPILKNGSLETDYGVNMQDYSLVAEEKAIGDKVLQSDHFEEHPRRQLTGKGGGEEDNGAEIVHEATETVQVDPSAVQFNQEVFKVRKEDEAGRAPDAPQVEAEADIKKMQFIEEEQEDGDNIAGTVKRVIKRAQKDQLAVEFNPEDIKVMKEDEVIRAPESPQTEAAEHPKMRLVQKEQENGENIIGMIEIVVKRAQKDQFMTELQPGAIQLVQKERAIDSSRVNAEENLDAQLIEKDKEYAHGDNDDAVGTIEDKPVLRWSEEEEEDSDEVDEDEEEIAEKGGDSSEETGGSSMESNTEAVRPVESIEELSLLKEETETNIQKLEEKIDEYRTIEAKESGCYASINNEGIYADGNCKNEDAEESIISQMKGLLMKINVSGDMSNMGIRISSAALLLLIVVAPLLLSFANVVMLCLIVFLLVMILSHMWGLP